MSIPPFPEEDELDAFHRVGKGIAGCLPGVGGLLSEAVDKWSPPPVEGRRRDWQNRLAAEVEERPTRADLETTYGLKPLADPTAADEPTQPFDASRRAQVVELFGAASASLLGWPHNLDGHWIERPELGQLRELLDGPAQFVALLGEPGTGKSALLARFSHQLRDDNAVFLAIKADLIPASVKSIEDLSEIWSLPDSLPTLLRKLAVDGKVFVLVDQLDALGELMDRSTQRFSVIQSLIDRLSSVDNVRLIISTRSFDAKYDLRLRALVERPVCRQLTLDNPPWEDIRSLLEEKGFDTGPWPVCVKDVLRSPQHLKLFLQLWSTAHAPTFSTYTGLLEELLQDRIVRSSPSSMNVLYDVAEKIGRREELWIPKALIDPASEKGSLAQLLRAGFLILDDSGQRIGFQHQTVYSFIQARRFLATDHSLFEFVRNRQDSLSVRPVLWSALHYLREVDRQKYALEMDRLLRAQGIRAHVKLLVVSTWSSIDDPKQEEGTAASRLLVCDPHLRKHALIAIAGKRRWLEFVRPALGAPELSSVAAAAEMSMFLRQTLSLDRELVLSFMERAWVGRSDCDDVLFATLRAVKHWDDRAFKVLESVASREELRPSYLLLFALDMVSVRPDLAVRLIRMQLELALQNRLQTHGEPQRVREDEENFETYIAKDKGKDPFRRLVDTREEEWFGIDRIADADPKEFVEGLWPWVVKFSEVIADDSRSDFCQYRSDSGWRFGAPYSGALSQALWRAVERFASKYPDQFLQLARGERMRETLAVHRLIVRGLTSIAAHHEDYVLEYLLGDPRRFAISETGFDSSDTMGLLRVVGPHLTAEQGYALVQAISNWSHRTSAKDPEGEAKRDRLNHQARLQLFSAMPISFVPLDAQSELADFVPPDYGHSFGGFVVSPISAERFSQLDHESAVKVLQSYPDQRTRGDAPLEGGASELSQEFARFAKDSPAKAIGIVEKLNPSNSFAAGRTLDEIAGLENYSPDDALKVVRTLVDKGFLANELFHGPYCSALEKIARRKKGLPAQDCETLEGLLRDVPAGDGRSEGDAQIDDPSSRAGEEKSVLWDSEVGIWPGGNYPILRALFFGLLFRDPPSYDSWMDILERHLLRSEQVSTWQALADMLPHLFHAERTRAQKFVEDLIGKHPEMCESVNGVRFFATAHRWFLQSSVSQFMVRLKSSAWRRAAQALGEFVFLRASMVPDDEVAARELARAFTPSEGKADEEFRQGVLFSAAATWLTTLRPHAHKALMQFVSADVGLASFVPRALDGDASQHVPNDAQTAELFAALTGRNDILSDVFTSRRILDKVETLLKTGIVPPQAVGLTVAITEAVASTVGDIRTAGPLLVPSLANIALTLHRHHETRAAATSIFERLLCESAYEIGPLVAEVDRRM